MNAFDLIVTVALGSALASTMLSKSVSLAEGMLGLTLLIMLQYAVTWLSVRSEGFQSLVKAQPRLLVHRGQWMPDAMRRERVTKEEVLPALRNQGIPGIGERTTVVLETEGSLLILTSEAPDEGSPALPRPHWTPTNAQRGPDENANHAKEIGSLSTSIVSLSSESNIGGVRKRRFSIPAQACA